MSKRTTTLDLALPPRTGDDPAYLWLCSALRNQILEGRLRPGARLAILEFGHPRIPGIRTLYGWYFRYLLPLVGRFVSSHRSAYSYLPASVGAFPPAAEFSRIIGAHGFTNVRAVPLTLGIVYLYVAERN